jgi:hypothetical protein
VRPRPCSGPEMAPSARRRNKASSVEGGGWIGAEGAGRLEDQRRLGLGVGMQRERRPEARLSEGRGRTASCGTEGRALAGSQAARESRASLASTRAAGAGRGGSQQAAAGGTAQASFAQCSPLVHGGTWMEAGPAAAAARGRMDAMDGAAWVASEVLGQRMQQEARQAQAAIAAVSLATCARLRLSS